MYAELQVQCYLLQVKKEGFTINVNIEDVGLTEHKKYTNKKWSLNIMLKK